MKRILPVFLLAIGAPLAAQDVSFSVAARGDLGIPTGSDLEDAETGFGFGVEAVAQFTPIVGVYAGYSVFMFGVDTGGEDFDADYTDSGFAVGGHLNVPVQNAALAPWVRAGAIYNMLELSASDGGTSVSFESDRQLGFEVGAGLDFPLGDDGLVLQPAVRYRAYSATFDTFGESSEGDVTYFTIGVGLAYSF